MSQPGVPSRPVFDGDGGPTEARVGGPVRSDAPIKVVSANIDLRQRLGEIWRYRELLLGLTRKELKVKYKNSVLGFLWSLLNPATSLLVFYIVFQIILRNGIPFFAIYLICGVLVWNLFSTALPGGCGSVVGNASIVKKVAFPREILALASVGAAFVHLMLQGIVMVFFMLVFRYGPAVRWLWLLIPAVLALLVLSSALAVLFAAVNVKFRDMQHLLDVGLQVWFWATPIVYQYRLVRDRVAGNPHSIYHSIFYLWRLNPVTPIVLTFQRALYARPVPLNRDPHTHQVNQVLILPSHASQWWYLWQLLVVMGFSVVLFAFALRVFTRLEGNFAEEL